MPPSPDRPVAPRLWRYLPAAVALLLVGAALNLWYLIDDCPLDLAGDEAHYWEWSRRLDLSYYSKGPLVAYIIAAGRALLADWSERVVGSEMLAVRIPAVVLSVISGLGIYVLGVLTLRRPALPLAALLLMAASPITIGSKLMTIDAPLTCAWVWALVCLERALRYDRLIAWVGVGLLIAVGILAKYNMLFIYPAVATLLLTAPELRRFWRRPGPYIAALLGTLGFLPILIWNAQHGWVSFRHVAGQAGVSDAPSFNLGGPFEYLLGQAAVINLFWFVGMILAGVELWRRPRDAEREPHESWSMRLLVIMMFTPWLVFLGFSPITKIQPNWPVLALVAGPLVLVTWLARRWRCAQATGRRWIKLYLIAGAGLGLTAVLIAHNTHWLAPAIGVLTKSAPPWDLTPAAKYDPTARLRGWSQLGSAVGEVVADERAAGRDPFILSDDYQVASQLAFYTPGEPHVYCAASVLGSRHSQYDLWTNPIDDPDAFVGRPVVYVGSLDDALTEGDAAALPGLTQVRTVEAKLGEHPVQIWSIFVAPRFNGFTLDPNAVRNEY